MVLEKIFKGFVVAILVMWQGAFELTFLFPHPKESPYAVFEISQRFQIVRRATLRQKQLVHHNFNLPCHMIHLTYLRILISSKYEDALASSEDPDQTAPLGAAWSGFALFA